MDFNKNNKLSESEEKGGFNSQKDDKTIGVSDGEHMENKKEVNDEPTQSKSFRYLDDLIHSGAKEIVLDSDILRYGDSYSDGIYLDVDDLTIDGNGHTIDAQEKGRIFHCTGKNITIKNITLKKGCPQKKDIFFKDNFGGAIYNKCSNLTIVKSILEENTANEEGYGGDGGAIYNDKWGKLDIIKSTIKKNEAFHGGAIENRGKLTITDSKLNNNSSVSDGGLIRNFGDLKISKSELNENISNENGGLVYNVGGSLEIIESIISKNNSPDGGTIYLDEGNSNIINCKFSHNASPKNIINNHDYLQIYNTYFKDNQAESLIDNRDYKSNLGVFNGGFINNNVKEYLIFNSGKYCIIEKSIFENNLFNNSKNIMNQTEMTLISPKIKDKCETIFNEGFILLKKSSQDILSNIYGKGTVETNIIIPNEERFDFGYLDKKIHQSDTKEIILDHDICFEKYEKDFYEGGIELNIDNLTIDGNGKTIDGLNESRIFLITGNDITLKNIIFKNGYSHKNYDNPFNSHGGAIKINQDIKLTVENCKFINNTSEDNGGAIYNSGELTITEESELRENTAENSGGAINNSGKLTVTESLFNQNTATDGGAIFNDDGYLMLSKSSFLENQSKYGDGAIFCIDKEKLKMNNCEFNLNKPYDGFLSKHHTGFSTVKYIKWQKATIYISSTFGDMHSERDYLVKVVFPELIEWCDERHIIIGAVDLRWGISEEDMMNKSTIGAIFRTIDKCRPFFICFLGQKRGWVPDIKKDIGEDTFHIFPELRHIDGMSAEELEIKHAINPLKRVVFGDEMHLCPPTKFSLFFFRDDSYLDNLSDSQRSIYTNDSEGCYDLIKLANEKLEKTKDKIRDRKKLEDVKSDDDESKVNIFITEYNGQWNRELSIPELNHFTDNGGDLHHDHNENQGRLTKFECNGKSLKDVIIEQLKEQLKIVFPDNMVIQPEDEFQKDLSQQEIFCYLNSEGFIERPKYTGKLKKYVEDSENNNVCLVSAEAGYATMLLAKFATDFEEENNDVRLYKKFCGASDLSSQTYSLWKSIIDEAEINEYEEFYPNNLLELKRNIPEILQAIADNGKSLIIIDAITQLPNGMDMLKWLGTLPENLKIIISVTEDRENEKFQEALTMIKARNNICSFEIGEFDEQDQRYLIDEYLGHHLKALDKREIDTICDFEASKNPLFLKILLEELRVFGSYDQLKNKIMMFGDSPKSAFNHVLERLEEDEEYTEGSDIVPLIFSLLAYSKLGLSEYELVDIIESQTDLDNTYIQNAIRLNLRQVKSYMGRKEGRHDFFYESFKLAAKERYAKDKITINESLATYFMGKTDPDNDYTFNVAGENNEEKLRILNELPYYLNETENYDELSDVLSSYSFIKNKLEVSDIYNLVLDYQFDDGHVFNHFEDNPIILIGRALELSAPVLQDHKDQLSEQLFGRLEGIDDEVIEKLLDEIDSKTSKKCLKSKSNVLCSPKSSIIKRIKAFGKKSITAILMPNDWEIIIGSEDGLLGIFDIWNNGLEILEEGTSKVIKIILNEDGYMIVANADGTIKEWDISNRMVTKTYPKIFDEITDMVISKTYDKIYVSSYDGVFSIDLETDELKREDIEHKNYNLISVDDSYNVLHICDESKINLYNLRDMVKIETIHHQSNTNDNYESNVLDTSDEIEFMGLKKRFLISISENGRMKFWNSIKSRGCWGSIDETQVCSPNDRFAQAKILEDENQIMTISDMGILRVWDIPQPRSPIFQLDIDIHTSIRSPTAIDYYTNGTDRWVLVGNENSDVSVIDLNRKIEEDASVRHAESVLSVKIDDNHIITASDDGEIFTWDLDNEQFINRYSNDFRCNSVSYNSDDKKLVFAGVKAEKDGRKTYKVAACNVSDDMWEAKGSEDTQAIELDVDERINPEEIIDITQNNSGTVFLEENKLVIGNDETKLDKVATAVSTKLNIDDAFVGFEDGSIVKYPDEMRFDSQNGSGVVKIKLTGDDRLIAGFEDGWMSIFALDGTYLTSLVGHEKVITDIEIMDNGQMASVSEDSTIKFWNLETGQCTYTYILDIYATAINVRGDKVVIGDTLGNVKFFDFE